VWPILWAAKKNQGGSNASALSSPSGRSSQRIGQFIGHGIEGKRPSFFKDVQFLMIGPLWLLADVYRRLGIRF